MIRHILSKYSEKEKYDRQKVVNKNPGETTYETSTIEISDPDEFFGMESTLETRTKENSDPDEFVLGPTVVTENVELSDPDEFVDAGPTKGTFSSEDSDPDEFLVGDVGMCFDRDFDEVLLI